MEKAVAQTKRNAQLEIAKNLLQNGVTVELGAIATGLPIEVIQAIEI